MKRVIVSLSVLLLSGLLSGRAGWAQNENFATPEASDVQDHEALVLQCVNHFSVEGIAGVVAVWRVEHVGPANIDSAGIHAFVENELAGACAQVDCHDVVQQAVVCGGLVTRILLP